jgi:hypothetical protein
MVLLLEPGDPQTSAEMTEVLGWGSALSRRVARCRPPPLALLARLEHRFRKPLLYPAELRGRKDFLAYPQRVWDSCLGLRSLFYLMWRAEWTKERTGALPSEGRGREFESRRVRQKLCTIRLFNWL